VVDAEARTAATAKETRCFLKEFIRLINLKMENG
jgi:hypothetical protein